MASAEQIKEAWNTDPDQVAHGFSLMLRGFGYPVDDAWVKAEIERLLAGGEVKGGPSLFIDGWLKEGTS